MVLLKISNDWMAADFSASKRRSDPIILHNMASVLIWMRWHAMAAKMNIDFKSIDSIEITIT